MCAPPLRLLEMLFRFPRKAEDCAVVSNRVEFELPRNVGHVDRSANGHPLPRFFELLDRPSSDLARNAQHEFRTVAADSRVVNANTVQTIVLTEQHLGKLPLLPLFEDEPQEALKDVSKGLNQLISKVLSSWRYSACRRCNETV